MAITDDDPAFASMSELWNDPMLRQFMTSVKEVAGYTLPDPQRAPFLRFHAFVTASPPPTYIVDWRSDPKRERWYHRHVDGVLGHVQNAIGCAWYHCENLTIIEERVRNALAASGLQEKLGHSTIGGGNTLRWDAEYQAFVLAVRRCLDYLARAVAAYFEQDHHSFNKLPKLLASAKPESVADAIRDARQRHVARFDYVLSDGERKSVRDLLSHYEFISAGTLNVGSRGFLVFGGGERLQPIGDSWDGGLSAVIAQRASDLHSCVADLLDSFVTSAAELDGSGSGPRETLRRHTIPTP